MVMAWATWCCRWVNRLDRRGRAVRGLPRPSTATLVIQSSLALAAPPAPPPRRTRQLGLQPLHGAAYACLRSYLPTWVCLRQPSKRLSKKSEAVHHDAWITEKITANKQNKSVQARFSPSNSNATAQRVSFNDSWVTHDCSAGFN